MLTPEDTATVCPECGTRLEGGFSSDLGRCMICLLRVGFDGAEEPNPALVAPVADRLGNYKIERREDGTHWELGRGAMGVTYRAVDTSLTGSRSSHGAAPTANPFGVAVFRGIAPAERGGYSLREMAQQTRAESQKKTIS